MSPGRRRRGGGTAAAAGIPRGLRQGGRTSLGASLPRTRRRLRVPRWGGGCAGVGLCLVRAVGRAGGGGGGEAELGQFPISPGPAQARPVPSLPPGGRDLRLIRARRRRTLLPTESGWGALSREQTTTPFSRGQPLPRASPDTKEGAGGDCPPRPSGQGEGGEAGHGKFEK